MFAEDLSRSGPSCINSSPLDYSTLVPENDGDAHKQSNYLANRNFESSIQEECRPQTTSESKTYCLPLIREYYQKRKFSEESITVICSSWRESTKLQYEVYSKEWIRFCHRRKIDPMLYNEVNCVHFLNDLFQRGKSYSALNTARSTLSCFLTNNAGTTIGNSPSVKRFLKGVFELKPPFPRYKFVWDVSIVLSFLGNFFPHEDLPLNVLSYKCAMLLALASMQRVQTLHVIDINDIVFTNEFVTIPLYKFCLLYTSPSPRDKRQSRMPSSA